MTGGRGAGTEQRTPHSLCRIPAFTLICLRGQPLLAPPWAQRLDGEGQKIKRDPGAGQHVGFNGIDIQAVTCQFCLATSRGEGLHLAGLG